MKAKTNCNIKPKDIQNYRFKLKADEKTQTELITNWINEFKQENNENFIQLKVNDENQLQCIFIQTSKMKDCYTKHPEIIHIDATFKINIENYLLFIFLSQNGNLNGVPICYCLMNTDTDTNLKFMYECFIRI